MFIYSTATIRRRMFVAGLFVAEEMVTGTSSPRQMVADNWSSRLFVLREMVAITGGATFCRQAFNLLAG